MNEHPTPDPDDEPDLEELMSSLLGGSVPPELGEMLSQMGLDSLDPAMLRQAASQVQAMFAAADDGIDLDQALAVARATIAATGSHRPEPGDDGDADPGTTGPRIGFRAPAVPAPEELARLARQTSTAGVTGEVTGDEEISDEDAAAVMDATRLAGLWLDEACAVAPGSPLPTAWNRTEWATETMPVWRDLVAPVADGMATAMASALGAQIARLGDLGDGSALGLPPGMIPEGMDASTVLGQLEPMMRKLSASMFSVQLGQAVGALSGEVLTGTEVGLPLVGPERVVLMPAAVEALAEGLDSDGAEVRLYLAVRELARTRLFGSAPWLGPAVSAAVTDYARDISFDVDAMESALGGIDPSDPQAMSEALAGQMFAPTPSAAQTRALKRLETWLALIEGWVDVVSEAAVAGRLPQAEALSEAVRRRRATGGPAERTFAALVGLELRPRRLRDAANLWAALAERHGTAARDSAWSHPDLAPTVEDLDDPLGYVERFGRTEADELDSELDALLRGGRRPGEADDADGSPPA